MGVCRILNAYKVVEVKVSGFPADSDNGNPTVEPQSTNKFSPNPIRIWIDIRISNGLHLTQKNLSYQDLVCLLYTSDAADD